MLKVVLCDYAHAATFSHASLVVQSLFCVHLLVVALFVRFGFVLSAFIPKRTCNEITCSNSDYVSRDAVFIRRARFRRS